MAWDTSQQLVDLREGVFGGVSARLSERSLKIKPTDPLTLFERKYSANSENLWQCEAILVEALENIRTTSAVALVDGDQNGTSTAQHKEEHAQDPVWLQICGEVEDPCAMSR